MRTRIRDLKNQAAQTMHDAQAALQHAQATLSIADKAILEMQVKGMSLMQAGLEAVEEFLDGVEFEVTFMGKTLPLGIRMCPREEQDQK